MYLFSSFDVDVERIRGHPPWLPKTPSMFQSQSRFLFFFLFGANNG